MDAQEIKQARRLAHYTAFLLSSNYGDRRAYDGIDMRTRVGKLAMKLIFQKEFKKDSEQIRTKRKHRALRKQTPSFINIFDRPIVKDYLAHPYVKVHSNRLSDGSRNHWAKDEKDLRILKILRR